MPLKIPSLHSCSNEDYSALSFCKLNVCFLFRVDTPSLPPVMVPKSQTSIVHVSLPAVAGSGTGPLPLEPSNRCLTNLNSNANTNLNTNLITPPTSGYVTDDSNGENN